MNKRFAKTPDRSEKNIDILDLHLEELSSRHLLTAEEERSLAKAVEEGRKAASRRQQGQGVPHEKIAWREQVARGKHAREILINHNLRLVVNIAKRYRYQGLPFADLIQEGSVGLITAVDRYDYRRGTRLSTYATPWIHQAMQRAIANYSRLIRLPVNWHSKLSQLRVAQQQLEQRNGRIPTIPELAAFTAIPEEKVKMMMEANQEIASLEKPVYEENAEFGDFLPDENLPDLDEELETEAQLKILKGLLAQLPLRDAKIMRLRYGLDDDNPLTNQAIGDQIGLSKERVRQIEIGLREYLKHQILDSPE